MHITFEKSFFCIIIGFDFLYLFSLLPLFSKECIWNVTLTVSCFGGKMNRTGSLY